MVRPASHPDQRVRIWYADGPDGSSVVCCVDVADPALRGHSAELRVVRKVKVKDPTPVHAVEVLFRASFASLLPVNEVLVARSQLQAYTYRGSKIDMEIHSELQVDDGFFVDTQIRQQEEMSLRLKPEVAGGKELVEPDDAFDLVSNLKAIPGRSRVAAVLLALVGLMRKPLRKYMTFDVVAAPASVSRHGRNAVEPRDMLRGRARVDLHDVIVRVVACNVEKGQYQRRSGNKTRTESFTEPVRAVVLYEKRLALLPAGAALEDQLDGTIRFEPMFRALYPPVMVAGTHGLALHWEVQLIHDQLVDQEVVCSSDCFRWEDFLDG